MYKHRFKTQLRGKEVDVEMEIQSMDPPKFTIVFYGYSPEGILTRKEVSHLCREASKQGRH